MSGTNRPLLDEPVFMHVASKFEQILVALRPKQKLAFMTGESEPT